MPSVAYSEKLAPLLWTSGFELRHLPCHLPHVWRPTVRVLFLCLLLSSQVLRGFILHPLKFLEPLGTPRGATSSLPLTKPYAASECQLGSGWFTTTPLATCNRRLVSSKHTCLRSTLLAPPNFSPFQTLKFIGWGTCFVGRSFSSVVTSSHPLLSCLSHPWPWPFGTLLWCDPSFFRPPSGLIQSHSK